MNICALGGISAHKEIAGPEGWWNGVAGIGEALDPTRHRLIGIDWIEEGDDGGALTFEQADHLARELDAAGVARLDLLIGASLGGNVALCFAARYPERVARLVILGAAHRPHPMATALRYLQREVVLLGLVTGHETEALEIARGIAMTTYRTAREFAGRFGTRVDDQLQFPVQRYLQHQGAKYADRTSPQRFLDLSYSLDRHEVDPASITTPTLLVAFEGDAIAPPWQMEELRDLLGGPADLVVIETIYGHDAFLKEPEAVSALLRAQLLEKSL